MKLALICMFAMAVCAAVAAPGPQLADTLALAKGPQGQIAETAARAAPGVAQSVAVAEGAKDNVAVAVSKVGVDGTSKAEALAKTLGASAGAVAENLQKAGGAIPAVPPVPGLPASLPAGLPASLPAGLPGSLPAGLL